MKPWFDHPCVNSRVFTILDPCHMIKLVRNAWSKLKVLYVPDAHGNLQKIEYSLIEKLNDLQQLINMRLANKLTVTHINYHNNVMNVKLAAQLLSRSVAESMTFCRESNIPGFENCQPTVEFLRHMNDIFDILNARNIRGKALKAPIRPARMIELEGLKIKFQDYIKSLRMSKNTPILSHSLHTGFLGLLSGLEVLFGLSEDLLMKDDPQDYFLPFKFSQDHIETWFGAIRAQNGRSNNPTARQLKSATQKLLSYAEIKIANGNCSLEGDISVLQNFQQGSLDAQSIFINDWSKF